MGHSLRPQDVKPFRKVLSGGEKIEVESLEVDVLKHYKKQRGTGSAHIAMRNIYIYK